VGASVNSAAASGTTLTFASLDPGTYPVTVANASPYQDATGSVDVVAGETAQVSIDLQVVAPTPPANASPVVTQTAPSAPPTSVSTTAPSGPSGGTSGGSAAPAVKALPNTGSGQSSEDPGLFLLLGAISLILAAGSLGWRRRRGR
jgi:hypothetical protein